MFYIPQYRDLINTSDYHYDELVLNYSKIDWSTDNLKLIKSYYRLNIFFHLTYTKHMNLAASNGHLEVVKWLHENRKEGCTYWAMDYAASNGHLEIVKWLHYNRTEGCSVNAMNYAATYGHLEIVKWLHENREEGCTTWAMDWASCNGHSEIVKWLKDNEINDL